MGIYLNPGNDAFRISVNDDIYVDKSGLISFVNSRINKRKRFICVSRPRRFGKSMAAEMLAAYYSRGCDSHELFRELEIAQDKEYRTHLNQHHVIYLNIQQFMRRVEKPEELSRCVERKVLEELREEFPDWVMEDETSLSDALSVIYLKSSPRQGFVFIVDEWDCIFREAKENVPAQKAYLEFLRDLFKDRIYVTAAYMTGILPIKKYGTHSELNIFDEFSMTNPDVLAPYVGFTEEEVKGLCEEFGKSFDEVKMWYDGYFGGNLHIYNPKSVVDGMQSLKLKSFWSSTETYEALQVYIDLNMDGLKEAVISMLGGDACPVDVGTFQNDMTSFKSRDDILTLLVHLGYLAYDEDARSVYIPNEEGRAEFFRAVKNGKRVELVRMVEMSDRLLEATLRMDGDEVGRLMEDIHDRIVAPIFYNNEQALRSVIKIAYLSSVDDFISIQELPSGKGYADVVFLPRRGVGKPALVVELKWDQAADGAIKQIRDRRYPEGIKGMEGRFCWWGLVIV